MTLRPVGPADAAQGLALLRLVLDGIERAVEASGTSPETVAEVGRGTLRRIEAQLPADTERRVLFALTAIADEWLLHRPPWPGQRTWEAHLLEEAAFGTRLAGERFFQLADAVLEARTGGDRLLASVLLGGVLIGFEGRYRGGRGEERLGFYREALHAAVYGEPLDRHRSLPAILQVPRPAAAPETPLRTLPSLKPYLAASILLVLTYLVGAHLIWSSGIRPILASSSEILTTGSTDDMRLYEADGP